MAEKDKASSLRFRLGVVDYLIAIKQNHKYSELEAQTGLKPSVLNRYVKGRVLPTEKRAKELIAKLSNKFSLEPLVLELVTLNPNGLVDDTKLVCSVKLLKLAALEAASVFLNSKANKVVTMASDGIQYATLVADLLGANLVVAKKEREKGVKKFHTVEVQIGDSDVVITAHVPFEVLRKGDRCVIVDDLVRSGETQEALTKLVEEAGAEVVGYSFLLAVTQKWREKIKEGVPLHVVATFER